MTQKTINLGTADQGNGDPLRVAFGKVNDNFTELYTALGLNVGGLNLGAFEFTGSVISTTDSSAIVIDQAVTVSSNLTVGGDVLPSVANGGDLGSSARPWKSLYISNNTIYIGGVALGVDANGNLTTGGTVVGSSPVWANITGKPTFAAVATSGAYADLTGKPTIPTLVSQLANDSGFLTSVGAISNIQSESDVSIRVNLTDSTTRIWQFGEDGNLAVPGDINLSGGTISQYSQNGLTGLKLVANADQGQNVTIMGTGNNTFPILNYVGTTLSGITIGTPEGDWNFMNGNLTIPGDIKSDSNINIEINLSDSTLRRWQFGEDGALTFPDGTNYAGKDITLPQTYGGVASKVSWNFSDIVFGNSTTFLEWNLLSTDFSEFLIGTSSAATPFYFSFDGSGQTLGTIDNGGIFGGGKLTFGSTAGNNAGDVNAIELKATNGDVYLTSTESVKITVDASDSSARVWLFDPTGNLTLPAGGVISEGGGISGAIRLTPAGGANEYQALLIYAGEGDHIHLTAGGGTTELYLGDDLHYVKLASDGNIRIQADNGVNGAAWTFGTDGNLTIPGDISSEGNINIEINLSDSTTRIWRFGEDGALTFPDGTSQSTAGGGGGNANTGNFTFNADTIANDNDASIVVGGSSLGNIEVQTVDELVPPGGVWRLFIGDEAYPTLGTTVQIGDTVTTSWGTPITATITDIQQDNGNWQIHVDQDITAGHNDYDTVTFSTVVTTKTWTFGDDGKLTLPVDGTVSYVPDAVNNWNQPTINTISAALDELAARVTAFENFEIDGGNANTPAVGELLIDGYGA